MKYRYKKFFLFIFFYFFLIEYIFSSGYIYTTALGKKISNNAVVVGLGNNLSLINSLCVMKYNPASLVDNKSLTLEINYGFYILDERIMEDKLRLEKNSYNYFTTPEISLFYPIRAKESSLSIGFGLGYGSEYENNYSYISASNTYTIISNIDSMTMPIVFGSDRISFSLSIKNISGIKNVNINSSKIEHSISGNSIVFGSKIKILNTTFGIGYNPQTELELKTSLFTQKVSFPEKILLAFKQDFYIGSIKDSSAYLEFGLMNYSKIKIDNIESGYNDIMTTSIGLEKSLSEEMLLRIGFFYEPNYIIRGSVNSGLSCGLGYDKNNLQFNLGLNYSKENYKGDDIIFSTKKVIDESYTNIVLGIKYRL